MKQRINFLPQVKLWNSAIFQANRINTWQDLSTGDLGTITYDDELNTFAVVLNGKNNPEWKYLLTSDSSNTDAVTSLRLSNGVTYTELNPGSDGVIDLYTGSLYDYNTNRLATMADVQGAVAGASLLGVKMDSSIMDIDSSYVMIYSDPSSRYVDMGGPSADKFNPLATVGTVDAAVQLVMSDVSNAIASLGNLFTLEAVYDTSFITDHQLTDFASLLDYLDDDPAWAADYDKGSVLIYGNEEWVLIDPTTPGASNSWELLGSLAAPDQYVTSFGTKTGDITISDSFNMHGNQLNLTPASNSSIGGIILGHTSGLENSNYIFDLKTGATASGNLQDFAKGYVSIPVVTGASTDASYGIVPNSLLQGNTQVYTAAINPTTCNVGNQYSDIHTVYITHNLGTSDVIVSVYKLKYNTAERPGRQLVYVDEIISSANRVDIFFGSPEAFIGCQEKDGSDNYLGYVVVIAGSTNATEIPDASIVPTVSEY